ncbi:MAG: hypothetical protein QF464_23340, partial [Myxococcota bacterium]|nr:hypothetical protein [Myxococcota bacterium]
LLTTLVAASLLTSQAEPLRVVAKHNGEGIEIRWFPPAPTERAERWVYRVDRIDGTGTTLTLTHRPLQPVLNVATIRDRLGSFAETYLGAVAKVSVAKRINEDILNEALTASVSRHLLLRFAVLYPEVAEILGWRRVDQDLQPGKTYTYRVIAIDRSSRDAERVLGETRAVAGRSGLSAPRSATASQPAPDRLRVTWSRDLVREKAEGVLRFVVYRRDGRGPWMALNPGLTSPLHPLTGSTSSYVDRQVLAGGAYQYAVSAVDLTGTESGKTTTATVTVSDQRPPPPPLDVALVSDASQLTLTWLVAGLPEDVAHIEVLKVARSRREGGPRKVSRVLGKVDRAKGTYRLRSPGLGHHEYAV